MDELKAEEGYKYIAVYGSLRKGCYNYASFIRHYGTENLRYIKTMIIRGFKLYNLGAYPGIKIGLPEDALVIDIMKASDDVYKRILRMEQGAGYEELSLNLPGYMEPIPIFLYKYFIYEKQWVKSGDWVEHIETLEKEKNELFEKITV